MQGSFQWSEGYPETSSSSNRLVEIVASFRSTWAGLSRDAYLFGSQPPAVSAINPTNSYMIAPATIAVM